MATYKSPFPPSQWPDETWAFRLNRNPGRAGGLAFPPALTGLADHRAWRRASEDARQQVLVAHLYRLLGQGADFELTHVNDVATWLATDTEFVPGLPEEARRDALKVFYDEATHAHLSEQLALIIESETGIEAPPIARVTPIPAPTGRLPRLVRLAEVVVVETLITRTMAEIPRHDEVDERVRLNIRFHAQDEARHRSFFRQVFQQAWATATGRERSVIVETMAQALLNYIRPDEVWLSRVLADAGIGRDPAALAHRVTLAATTPQELQRQAAPTVDLLRSVGALRWPKCSELFIRLGLI